MNRRHFFTGSLAAAVTASLPASAYAQLLHSMTTVSSSIVGNTGDGAEVEIEQAAVEELKGALRGRLLLPGSDGYDIARRVLNPSIDRFPALIVQPSGAADVQNAVTFARERGLLLAVKCGGHSFSGKSTCDGGLQIDLSSMRHVRVDRGAQTAHVAGGCLLGELDHEAMAHGLVTTAGTVSHTGVGGLTLGGGFGRLARKHGLALDNVRSVDIVTADGQLRHASADENPDLYWGVRGGGGNFGVVTSFEFQLHPMDRTVIAGDVVLPIERAKEFMRFYADYSREAPDELSLDFIMPSAPGQPGVAIIHAVWSGDPRQADRVLAPLNRIANPIANTIGAKDYVALQRTWDNSDPRQGGDYLKSGFVYDIDDRQIDAIIDGFEPHPDRATNFFFQASGGAIGRVPVDATAFPSRAAINAPTVVVSWNKGVDPDPHIAYIREYWATIEPFTRGFYINVEELSAGDSLVSNFEKNYERLVSVKNEYDPTNLFRLNSNIKPTV